MPALALRKSLLLLLLLPFFAAPAPAQEGVTGQQELHDVFTRVGHLLRIGTDY
jgi:hypothetical protein